MIRERLAALEPELVEIYDESGEHIGHAGAQSGGGHYQLTIVSPAFDGQSRVARHRMVYDALGDMMQKQIHALGDHGLDRRGAPQCVPGAEPIGFDPVQSPARFHILHDKELQMQFCKTASAAAVALAGVLVLAACNAEDNVAVVNGVPIPQARMDYVVKARSSRASRTTNSCASRSRTC